MSNPEDPTTETETRAEDISDELAKKYDPERLLRIMSKRAGRGESLDHTIRHKYEKRFGVDLGHVRLFSGEFAEEFNRQRNAYAVTIGSTGIILMGGSAEKSMGSTSGQALLAHELTHVAQQKRGLHRKATFEGAMPFGEEHEAEADAVEQEVASGDDGRSSTTSSANAASAKAKSEDQMKEAMEHVKERVLELAADAARTHMVRGGGSRRA
ncbi:MAG: DUF4157 domain-containing protein [Kofleriaceae bacterium]